MNVFHLVALVAILALAALFFLVLAEPGLPYHVAQSSYGIESHEFVGLVASLVDVPVFRNSQVGVLSNGADFYAAELAAISQARRSVHLEAFLFWPSPIGDRFLAALTGAERENGKNRALSPK